MRVCRATIAAVADFFCRWQAVCHAARLARFRFLKDAGYNGDILGMRQAAWRYAVLPFYVTSHHPLSQQRCHHQKVVAAFR